MTPETILSALEKQGPLPTAALCAAGQSRDDMVPVFLDYIERLQSADISELETFGAFIFIFHLLGEWRDVRAYRPLAKLLRRESDFMDALMGDALTETSARVMAGVFDGDLKPLFQIILDDEADAYVRGEMFDTLAMLALQNPTQGADIKLFLTEFFDLGGPSTSEEVWWSWATCIAALGLSNMTAPVRSAFESGLISKDHSRYEDFEAQLSATIDKGRPDWFEKRPNNQLISNTIAELGSWHCFAAA
jgi:hypothetical protein